LDYDGQWLVRKAKSCRNGYITIMINLEFLAKMYISLSAALASSNHRLQSTPVDDLSPREERGG
jgi:hypothetical protein